jgi:hypothetical protein
MIKKHDLKKMISDVLEENFSASEGYGAGDPKTDTKSAGRWKVHFPSEKDWNKNKKSLSKVFEDVAHEKNEVQLYKLMSKILDKLIAMHGDGTSSYDENKEEKLQQALKLLVSKLEKSEKNDPDHSTST